jgi:opacity protein-like surface antigen
MRLAIFRALPGRHLLILSGLFLSVAGWPAAPTLAQDTETDTEPVEVVSQPMRSEMEAFMGGRLGYLEVDEVDEGSPIIGFCGGFRFHPHLAVTGSLDFHTANYSLEDRWTLALTASLEVALVSNRFRVQPYGLAGLGAYMSSVERVDEFGSVTFDDTESDGGYHAGAGLDINLPEHEMAVNVEARWIFTQEEEDPREVRPDGVQYTVGLRFEF